MKYLSFLLLSSLPLISYSQFAIVTDKDGYANIRNKPQIGNNIQDTLSNGRLLYCMEDQGNWSNIDYSKGKDILNGWIYKDRYFFITSYPSIPTKSVTPQSIKLSNDSLEITVMTKPFDKSKHTYTYDKDTKSWITLIDNKQYWGTDGGLPKFEYKSITIKSGTQIIILPPSALQNLYEPDLDHTEVNIDKINNIIYIQSTNSDGAGSYSIIWKIENNVYKERLIMYGF